MEAAEKARAEEVAALRAQLEAAGAGGADGCGGPREVELELRAVRLRAALSASEGEVKDAHRLGATSKLHATLGRARAQALLGALFAWRGAAAADWGAASPGANGAAAHADGGDARLARKLAFATRLLATQQAEIGDAHLLAFGGRLRALLVLRATLAQAHALGCWSRAALGMLR